MSAVKTYSKNKYALGRYYYNISLISSTMTNLTLERVDPACIAKVNLPSYLKR